MDGRMRIGIDRVVLRGDFSARSRAEWAALVTAAIERHVRAGGNVPAGLPAAETAVERGASTAAAAIRQHIPPKGGGRG